MFGLVKQVRKDVQTTPKNLTSWLSRYGGTQALASGCADGCEAVTSETKDAWSGQPVTLTRLECKTETTGNHLQDKARLLQNMDHAHIQPIIDFHVEQDHFFFVSDARVGKNLFRVVESRSISPTEILTWTSQYLSVLCFFELLAPHMVPELPEDGFTIDEKGGLRICKYQIAYLLGKACSDVPASVAQFIDRVCGNRRSDHAVKELLGIVDRLSSADGAKRRYTLHQARSAVKQAEEIALAEAEAKEA